MSQDELDELFGEEVVQLKDEVEEEKNVQLETGLSENEDDDAKDVVSEDDEMEGIQVPEYEEITLPTVKKPSDNGQIVN